MAYSLDQATERMREAHERRRLAHAYLVTGPLGAGKEKLACRIIGIAHGNAAPESLDAAVGDGVIVLRPQSKSRRIRVDAIAEMEEFLHLTAGKTGMKIGVIVEADRLMEQAANKFLKSLEEPPGNALLMLLTANPERLLPTILSRCIEVPLLGPTRVAPEAGSAEASLLNLLSSHGTLARRGVSAALLLAKGFGDLLAERKELIAKRFAQAFKEESAAVRSTTEGGTWLNEREEEIEAMVQADFLAEREHLLGTLVSWFGDAVRLRSGVGHLDLPECRSALEKLAKRAEIPELLRRQSAIEKLLELMQTNTSEALAIEVSFLKAFR